MGRCDDAHRWQDEDAALEREFQEITRGKRDENEGAPSSRDKRGEATFEKQAALAASVGDASELSTSAFDYQYARLGSDDASFDRRTREADAVISAGSGRLRTAAENAALAASNAAKVLGSYRPTSTLGPNKI
jgi:hypothetical protein